MDASRRRFLRTVAGGVAAPLMVPGAGAAAPAHSLELYPATIDIGGDRPVSAWTFNGRIPGPELRVTRGGELSVAVHNGLQEPTAVHWHGIRIANAMDGVPGMTQEPIAPGARFDYRFTAPDAGTFWYHSHMRSSEQVDRGLYGLLVVEEEQPYPVDRELPLIVDDWRLDETGDISADFGNMHDASHGGRLGNWITVNGVSTPDIPVSRGERLRLRLVNTANARVMTLAFSGHPLHVIALDGQPVAPFQAGEEVTLAPAQRADVVVDMTAEPGARVPIQLVHQRGVLTVAHLAYRDTPGSAPRQQPPPALPPNPLDTRLQLDRALRRELVMAGGAMGSMASAVHRGREMPIRELVGQGMAWSLNGVAGLPEQPLFRAPRGSTVVLDLVNDNRWPHAMHIHGHHFRVIEGNGQSLPDSPWRDTTLLFGFDRVTVAFKADNPGKWLLHCHMIEHMAAGMLTWFEVA